MALNLIGLGLFDEKDISVKGLEIARESDEIFIEQYTSKLFGTSVSKISELIGKEVKELDRENIEQDSLLIDRAEDKDISLLVGGDPLVATTHYDLFLEARKGDFSVNVIHSSSIYTAICETGLFIYKFGKSCSVPYSEEGYEPKSFLEVIEKNKELGTHTLVFLDLEPNEDRYMTVSEAIDELLESDELTESDKVIGIARLGSNDSEIKYGKAKDLKDYDFGSPLHCMVVPGDLHFKEKEALRNYEC